jgi:hypothetical protein
MSGDELPALLVSDADRERAVTNLREHLSAGRLTLEEFTERIGEAYAARTGVDLERASRDLPAVAERPTRPRRGRKRLTLSLFSHIVRRGRWRLPKLAFVVSFLGDFDLRHRARRFSASGRWASSERPTSGAFPATPRARTES